MPKTARCSSDNSLSVRSQATQGQKKRAIVSRLTVKQSPGAKPRFFYGYIVVLSSLVLMIAVWGTRLAFGVFFKPVITEFGWTRAMFSGAFSLSMIIEGLIGILTGAFTDKLGPRRVLTLCGILLGAGYLLMAQLSAAWQLYLFYGILVGTGMSGFFIPVLSTIARWFVTRRNIMTGVVLAGTGIGNLVAGPASNWLITTYDWRTSYLITGALALVLLVSLAQLLKRDPSEMGQVPYGGSGNTKPVIAEAGVREFSLEEAVCTRQFWLFFGMLISFGFWMFAILVHIVPHATGLGVSAAAAANILATIGAASIVGRMVLGGIADRIGNKQIFIWGFASTSAGFFWLISAREAWMLYLFAAVFGFFQGGMGVSESPLVARLFGLGAHGLIFGVAGLGFTLGGAIGPFLAGYIFDITSSYQSAFLLSGIIGILGLICTIALKPMKSDAGKIQ